MVSRNRKIARRIGQAVANDVLDISGAISAGAGVTVYATADDLPTTGLTAGDEAFVSGSNRLYISNGTGWYSIGLVNTNPAITSVEDPSNNTTPFTLATDGSALVLTITAADPEDIPLTYNYAVTTGSLTNGGGTTATVVQGTGASTNQFTITPTTTEAYAGTFELTFTATDGINTATSGANSFTLEFIIDWTTTTQQQKLMISDAAANDFLGAGTGAISIDDDYIVIGCYVKEAAYIFVRSGSTWTQQQKLTASDGQSGDGFGKCVHISGTSVIVGSSQNQSNGAAYIFTRSGSTWTQQQKLTASDGAANDYFGNSVVIDGDNAIIGAFLDDDGGGGSGSAYVFTRSGSTWTQQGKLIASDDQASDRFGTAVDINNDYAIVGATFEDAGGNESGAAYIFVRSGSTWTQQQKLTASDAGASYYFGNSVAIDGDTALVASYWNDHDGVDKTGAGYVFTRSGSTWTQQQKLTSTLTGSSRQLGMWAALEGDNIVMGSGKDKIVIYSRSGSTWTQDLITEGDDTAANDRFSFSVDISGRSIISSAEYEDEAASNAGAVYVFIAS
jgi:hypothetical protein